MTFKENNMLRSQPTERTRYHEMRRNGFLLGNCPWPALIFLVGALGCSSMGSLEPMEVTLTDLDVTEVTVFETSLLAKLRITNPNPDPMTIDGASFKLYLEDKKVGTGTTKESFTVDRLDSNVIDVVFHINNASALLRLKDIFDDNDVSYGVRGALYTEGAFGTKKIRIEKTGRLDLSDLNPKEIEEPGDED
jgi:LEA14-like dessication related protein